VITTGICNDRFEDFHGKPHERLSGSFIFATACKSVSFNFQYPWQSSGSARPIALSSRSVSIMPCGVFLNRTARMAVYTLNTVLALPLFLSHTLLVPSRRLDDRIRALCSKAATISDGDLQQIMSELRSCLREHNERLRKKVADQLGGGKVLIDRRGRE